MKKQRLLETMRPVILAAVLIITSLCCLGMKDMTYAADGEKSITGLGTGTIQNPSSSGGGWNYVYYGKMDPERGGDGIRYRVLDKASTAFGGNTMLLDCDWVVRLAAFDSDNSNVWETSSLRRSLNGSGFYSKEGMFSAAEKAAIAESTKSQANGTDGSGSIYHSFAPLSGEKIFLLDAVEATCPAYGYGEPKLRIKGGDGTRWWWLRSSSYTGNYVACIYNGNDGIIVSNKADARVGVSPAFNVNLSSILFSSAASGMFEPQNAYKLTLKDDTLNISNTGSVTRNGNTIKVPCTVTGGSNRVSVLMTNGEWKNTGWSRGASVKYYGKLNGSKEFVLPGDYNKNWNVYILAEQVNGERETDYASAPVKITIPENQTEDQTKDQMGIDGTPVGPGASAATAEKAITGMKDDNDPAGTVYGKLQLRSSKQKKTSLTLKWNSVSGAAGYVLYGNKCGRNNRMQKLGTYKGTGVTLGRIIGKKVKKGTYYKFILVALDRNNKVISTSKAIHVATKGGKVTNPKKVTVKSGKKTISSVSVKAGQTAKLKSKVKKASGSKKLKKHRPVKYESSNPKIAGVSDQGVITGRSKGTCYIYAYAQNGVCKRIKVTVQ